MQVQLLHNKGSDYSFRLGTNAKL